MTCTKPALPAGASPRTSTSVDSANVGAESRHFSVGGLGGLEPGDHHQPVVARDALGRVEEADRSRPDLRLPPLELPVE
jgi:hypothetical protein